MGEGLDADIRRHHNSKSVNAKSYAAFCARMTMFLPASEDDSNRQKSRFPFVNRLSFETKRNVLKSMTLES
jgi:hypothetical protein